MHQTDSQMPSLFKIRRIGPSMKKQPFKFYIATLLSLALSLFPTIASAETSKLELPHSALEVDNGSFWMRRWVQKEKEYAGIDLKTVTNFDSALLMTFSGAD